MQKLPRGELPPGHECGGCALPPGRPHVLWVPRGSPPLIPAPTRFVFLQKEILPQLKPVFQLILLPFSISLLKAPFIELLWGIVLRYVTPSMVQLVFILVLYLLLIFVAQVTLFLSLHVKFMWSKVVLMHDIASRHLQEQLLSMLLSLVHFYF